MSQGGLLLDAPNATAPLRVPIDAAAAGARRCVARKTGGVSIDLPALDYGADASEW